MMNSRTTALLLVAALSVLAFTVPAASQPSDNIIVNNADEVRETSVSVDQGLVDSLASVAARVVLQYANDLRHIELTAAPSSLQVLLDQVSNRIAVQYANVVRHADLAAPPGVLQMLLEQVSERIAFQYANASRQESLIYPASLFNDTTPPEIRDIRVSLAGSGSVNVTWTTDEFATSAVLYGTQPGVYSQTATDPLFTKQHGLTLSGIAPETAYYYRVRSTDRSSNTATSDEGDFTLSLVYLPLVVRNGP